MPLTNIRTLGEQKVDNTFKITYAIKEQIAAIGRKDDIKLDEESKSILESIDKELDEQLKLIEPYIDSLRESEATKQMHESDDRLSVLVDRIYKKFDKNYKSLGDDKWIVDVAQSVSVALLGGLTYDQYWRFADGFDNSKNHNLENAGNISFSENGIERMVNYTLIYDHSVKLNKAALQNENVDYEIATLPTEVKDQILPVFEKVRKLNEISVRNRNAVNGSFEDDYVDADTINDLMKDLDKLVRYENPLKEKVMKEHPIGKALSDFHSFLKTEGKSDMAKYRNRFKNLTSLEEFNRIRHETLDDPVSRMKNIDKLSEDEIKTQMDRATLYLHMDRMEEKSTGLDYQEWGLFKHADFNPLYNAYEEAKDFAGLSRTLMRECEKNYASYKFDLIRAGEKTAGYEANEKERRAAAEKRRQEEERQREERWQNATIEERKKIDSKREQREWLQHSVKEMYELNKDRTLSTFKDERYSWEKISEVPEAAEAYWNTLNWKEKTALSKERSDEEWKTYTKEQKLETDREREQREWDNLDPNAKYAAEKDRYFSELKEKKTAIEDIEKNAGKEIADEYYNSFSYAEKTERFPDRAALEWKNASWDMRYQLDEKKAENEWKALPFKEKQAADSDRAEALWNKTKKDHGFGKDLMDLDPERAQKEWEEFYLSNPEFNINSPKALSGDNAGNQSTAQYASRYWGRLSFDEKVKSSLNGAKDRLADDLINEKPAMETVNKAGKDVADRFFNSLSLKDKKSEKYKDEYERRFNEADYEGKKALDPERAGEYFSSLSYEEKKNLNMEDTNAWFNKLSDKEKRWTDLDKAVDSLAGERPEAKSDSTKLTSEEKDRIKELTGPLYVNSDIVTGGGRYKHQIDRIFCRILSSKCTAQDIVNLRVLHTEINSRYEDLPNGGEEHEALQAFEDFMKNFPDLDFDTFRNVSDEELHDMNVKFDKDGYVVLSDKQKKELLNVREGIVNVALKDKDIKAIMDDAYNTLYNQAKEANNGFNQAGALDRESDAKSAARDFIQKNPEFRYVSEAEMSEQIVDYEDNKKKLMEQTKAARFNDLKEEGKEVENLKTAWSSMKSHTISIFNSKAYDNMEKAFNNYTKAYDNLMAGKTIDGKSARPNGDQIEDAEINALRDLQEKMQKAANDYTAAKRAQKGGGIDKHSTKQGEDRLAMADLLSGFDVFPKFGKQTEEKTVEIKNNGKVKNVKLSELEGSERARATLNVHKDKLRKKELNKASQKQNEIPSKKPEGMRRSTN